MGGNKRIENLKGFKLSKISEGLAHNFARSAEERLRIV
jgi:hypothetical protein